MDTLIRSSPVGNYIVTTVTGSRYLVAITETELFVTREPSAVTAAVGAPAPSSLEHDSEKRPVEDFIFKVGAEAFIFPKLPPTVPAPGDRVRFRLTSPVTSITVVP